MATQTLGQRRVRVNFNVSEDGYIQKLKEKASELIDFINEGQAKKELNAETKPEFDRLKSLAITHIENGAMWGVKALTI